MKLTEAERSYLIFVLKGDIETLHELAGTDDTLDNHVELNMAKRLLERLSNV